MEKDTVIQVKHMAMCYCILQRHCISCFAEGASFIVYSSNRYWIELLVHIAIHNVFCKNYFPLNLANGMSVIVVPRLIICWEGCNCGVRLSSIVFSVAENHRMPLGPHVSGWRIMSPFNKLAWPTPTSLYRDTSSARVAGAGELTDSVTNRGTAAANLIECSSGNWLLKGAMEIQQNSFGKRDFCWECVDLRMLNNTAFCHYIQTIHNERFLDTLFMKLLKITLTSDHFQ